MPGHGHRDRHVDADHADLDAASECTRHAAIAGEARHAIAELVGIDQRHGTGKIRNVHNAQHRAEDFLLVDLHLRRDVVEQRRANEKALLGTRHLEVATINEQPGALFDALIDETLDLGLVHGGDQRSHVRIGLHAVADLELVDAR